MDGFQAPLALPGGACSAPPCGAAAAVPGDFDGDGARDLVVVDYRSYEVAVLMGNGNGTFGGPVPYSTGPSPATIAVADLTGNGVPDLAVPNWDFNAGSTLSVLVGNGDGTFQAAQRSRGRGVLESPPQTTTATARWTWPSPTSSNSVTVMINASGPPSVVPHVNKAGTEVGFR
jgi:hypothetical protein